MLTFDPSSHTYRLDGEIIPSVTTILSRMGFINHDWFTDEAEKRGTLVHRGIHCHEQGLLNECPEEFKGYLEAWEKFKRDTDFEVEKTEVQMCSRTYRFAGTADVFGRFRRAAVLDLKTGEKKAWWPLQVAGYSILAAEVEGDAFFRSRFSLRLHEDGTYHLDEYKDRADRQAFLNILGAYHALNKYT